MPLAMFDHLCAQPLSQFSRLFFNVSCPSVFVCVMLLSRGECFCYCIVLTLCIFALLYHFSVINDSIGPIDIQYIHLLHTVPPHTSSIPKILWYKLGPHGLNNDTRNWTSTCIAANPSYTTHFLTDADADDFVKEAFHDRPEIFSAYTGLTVPILKADMLRYMLLYAHGGIWSDLDVSCEVSIGEWIPAQYRANASVVMGWEFDVGWSPNIMRQFASWIMMAKPRSPHMLQVIDDIVAALQTTMQEYDVTVENVTLAMTGDVVDFSGPRRLTTGVFRSLEKMLERRVDPNEAKNILQPMMIGDVLVMPGRSFAASSNHYSDEQEGLLPERLVTHHYAGSWKNDKGGELRRSASVG